MGRNDDRKELIKEAMRELIDEWLDNKYRTFGKWSIMGILAFIFSFFAHGWLSMHVSDIKVFLDTSVEQLAK